MGITFPGCCRPQVRWCNLNRGLGYMSLQQRQGLSTAQAAKAAASGGQLHRTMHPCNKICMPNCK
jgi:hypothetical protein